VGSNAVETGLLSVGSLTPIVGVVAFDWGPTAVATLYLAEILALVCSYAVVGLFGQPPSAVDERERTELPLLPTPDLERTPERVDLPGLPPIRAENVHIVGVSAVFYGLIGLTVGAIVTGSLGEASSPDSRTPLDLSGFLGEVLARLDPAVVILAGVVVCSQLAVVSRWYVTPSRHQTLSAYAVTRRLSRVLIAQIAAGAVWCLFGGLSLVVVGSFVPFDTVAVLVAGFCLVKLQLERRRIAGESDADGDRGAWLVPADRPRG